MNYIILTMFYQYFSFFSWQSRRRPFKAARCHQYCTFHLTQVQGRRRKIVIRPFTPVPLRQKPIWCTLMMKEGSQISSFWGNDPRRGKGRRYYYCGEMILGEGRVADLIIVGKWSKGGGEILLLWVDFLGLIYSLFYFSRIGFCP